MKFGSPRGSADFAGGDGERDTPVRPWRVAPGRPDRSIAAFAKSCSEALTDARIGRSIGRVFDKRTQLRQSALTAASEARTLVQSSN